MKNFPSCLFYRKEFCFNDWSAFDTDNDCQFDFFQGDKLSDYRSAFASLQQIGYVRFVPLRKKKNRTIFLEVYKESINTLFKSK